MTELKANHSLRALQKFVQRAFVVNYNSRDVDATKALDKMTKNIAILIIKIQKYAGGYNSILQ
ncbi:hypothetical protein RhiirA1_486676 [Rhizophagus irregularis]|uniref:Uncharacterized protein n=1 Tax=Rhizophagus irregularis TaxID=588596 RepID=A0A2N0QH12_9GLOM|nr:hypothetical protein RhiirA1_486676 [Rhizophagus irregularis]